LAADDLDPDDRVRGVAEVVEAGLLATVSDGLAGTDDQSARGTTSRGALRGQALHHRDGDIGVGTTVDQQLGCSRLSVGEAVGRRERAHLVVRLLEAVDAAVLVAAALLARLHHPPVRGEVIGVEHAGGLVEDVPDARALVRRVGGVRDHVIRQVAQHEPEGHAGLQRKEHRAVVADDEPQPSAPIRRTGHAGQLGLGVAQRDALDDLHCSTFR